MQTEIDGHCSLCSAEDKNQVLESMVSATGAQLPGIVFRLNYMISLTLTHTGNGSIVYYLTLLISDSRVVLWALHPTNIVLYCIVLYDAELR